MALVEWFLNDGRSEKKLASLLRDPRYEFVPIDIRQILDTARRTRNKIVHESPTRKLATHDPNAYSTRKGVPDPDSLATLRAFKDAVSASFELYRCVNRRRTANPLLSANAPDGSRTVRDQPS